MIDLDYYTAASADTDRAITAAFEDCSVSAAPAVINAEQGR